MTKNDKALLQDAMASVIAVRIFITLSKPEELKQDMLNALKESLQRAECLIREVTEHE